MTEDIGIEIPTQYTHSIKLSDTAKGIRIDVHVYANSKELAVSEAFQTYLKARTEAVDNKIPLAPKEVK